MCKPDGQHLAYEYVDQEKHYAFDQYYPEPNQNGYEYHDQPHNKTNNCMAPTKHQCIEHSTA